MKPFLIISLILFSTTHFYSQPDNPVNDIVSPGPNPASLGLFGNTDISPESGTANIQIDLINFTGVHLSVPVSLSYHSSGTKIEQIASWIGLGWSLNAGGVITRTKYGDADESGFFQPVDTIPDPSSNEYDHYCYFDQETDDMQSLDSEPDVFSFNIPGYVGEFFFDQQGNIYHSPYQDLKITTDRVPGSFNSFTIITPEGVKYKFGTIDKDGGSTQEINLNTSACTGGGSGLPEPVVTAWYLEHIEHPLIDRIDLTYGQDIYSYTQNVTETEYLNITAGGNCSNINDVTCTNTINLTTPILKTIESVRGELRFISGTTRMDLTNADELDRIEHYGPTGVLLESWDMSFSHFTSANPSSSEDYRLRLDSVQHKGSSGSVVPPHRFEYYPGTIPGRLSAAQDHWGYYNGETTNNSLIPITPYGGQTIGSAYRDVDPAFTQVGVLKRVIYPTCGYTEIEYEGNEYSNLPPFIEENVDMCASVFAVSCSQVTTSFTIGANLSGGQLTAIVTYTTPQNCTPILNEARLAIINTNTNQEVISWTASSNPGMTTVNVPISPGNYELKAFNCTFQDSDCLGLVSYLIVDWTETETRPSPPDSLMGGLRVSRTFDHDGSQITNEKLYSYNFSSGISSGFQHSPPDYVDDHTVVSGSNGGQFGLACQTTSICEYRKFTSISHAPVFYKSGNNVSYREITITQPGNGKTVLKYDAFPDEGVHGFPYSPFRSNMWKRGLLKERIVYDQNGNELEKEENTYKLFDQGDFGSARGLTVGLQWQRSGCTTAPLCSSPDIVDHKKYAFEFYERKANAARIQTQKITRDGVQTIILSSYDPLFRSAFLRKSDTRNSDNTLFTTHFSYTHDYPFQNDIRDQLIAENRIIPAWQQVTIVSSSDTISGSQLCYGQLNLLGSVLATDFYSPTLTHIFPAENHRFEASWDKNGVYTKTGWQSLGRAQQYNTNHGQLERYLVDGWADPLEYTWTSHGQLDSTKFKDYKTKREYYSDNLLLQSKTDRDGTSSSYTHDDLLRLQTITDDQRGTVTTIDYQYKSGINNKSWIKTSILYPTLGNALNKTVAEKIFMDDLGKPIQILKIDQAPDGNSHIVINTEYDNRSRMIKQYEPFSIGGSEDYNTSTTSEFTLSTYELSPLNRPKIITPPSWHSTTFDYGHNTGTVAGFAANTLNKLTTTDPNGNKVETYTDKRGREVLMRKLDSNNQNANDTETIWNNKDQKSKILPPGFDENDTDGIYHFVYYPSSLMKSRDLPDADPIEYVYSPRELLIYQRDGEMKADSRWLAMIHDDYGREVERGFQNSTADFTLVNESPGTPNGVITSGQELIDHTYGTSGITIDKIESSEVKILNTASDFITKVYGYNSVGLVSDITTDVAADLSKTYAIQNVYDAMDNLIQENFTTDAHGQTNAFIKHFSLDQTGRHTGESVQQNSGSSILSLYSTEYTPKEQVAETSLGGQNSLVSMDYDYLPNGFLKTMTDPIYTQELYYDTPYDGNATARLNGDISSTMWAVKGRDSKVYHYGYDYKDQIDTAMYYNITQPSENGAYDSGYEYDERGNITGITRVGPTTTKSKFTPPDNPGNGPFTGSGTGLPPGISRKMDDLKFSFKKGTNKIRSVEERGDKYKGYKERNPGNGKPNGKNANSYTYDANGNIITDPSRGITITMNHLNKVNRITQDANNYIDYFYDAEGILHRKVIVENGEVLESRDYLSQTEFKNGVVDMIHFSEGFLKYRSGLNYVSNLNLTNTETQDKTYLAGTVISTSDITNQSKVSYLAEQTISMNGGFEVENNTEFAAVIDSSAQGFEDWEVHYTIKDHLGNTRVVFSDMNLDGGIDTSEILQVSEYYPFGAEHNTSKTGDYAYRYNGKEKELGLDIGLLRYGARDMDPWTARFRGVDPLADHPKLLHNSPYSYGLNNPVKYIDVQGLAPLSVNPDPEPNVAAVFFGTIRAGALQLGYNAVRRFKIWQGADPASIPYKRFGVYQDPSAPFGVSVGYEDISVEPSIGRKLVDNTLAVVDVAAIYPTSGVATFSKLPGMTVSDLIKNVTKNFGDFQCKECADAVVNQLKSEGVSGQIIDLTTPTNRGMSANIYSDVAGKNISLNGTHRGVLIDGKVYDNIHQNGISYEDWLKDLNAPQGYNITKTKF